MTPLRCCGRNAIGEAFLVVVSFGTRDAENAATEDFLVSPDVLGSRGVVVEARLGLTHDALDLFLLFGDGTPEELHGPVDAPAQATGIEDIEAEAIAAGAIELEWFDGVVEPTGVVGDGERSIFWSNHLWQPARLE